ncbi:MAG: hypothetical protein M3374_02930, partial [Pseudomonadota bacterium]|nr:hypothetical protein [Pseudomonadota bacterium]
MRAPLASGLAVANAIGSSQRPSAAAKGARPSAKLDAWGELHGSMDQTQRAGAARFGIARG